MKIIYDIAKDHYFHDSGHFVYEINRLFNLNFRKLASSDTYVIFSKNVTYIHLFFNGNMVNAVIMYDDFMRINYFAESDLEIVRLNEHFSNININVVEEFGKYFHELEEHEKEILRMKLSLS